MANVRILPEQVANQIAAGEVIERPAAVVKELLENSLDAGATQIEVAFRQGGKTYMHIQDNGHGMTPDNALLALERHATSKIQTANDLITVGTLGFRGEALPSIASVSRFKLRTRSKDRPHGLEIVVNAGAVVSQADCGMSVGTRIEVSQLFNSVPVRRKFLKTDQTESGHIIQLVRLYALAYPHVAFTLIENNRTLFQSPVCHQLRDRVSEVWGSDLVKDLIDVEAESEGMAVQGLVGKHTVSRASRHEMITILNGRPVENRALYYGITESYQGSIPKGRYPLAFLILKVPPETVDVNVHPAKREVRFKDERAIKAFVIKALEIAFTKKARSVVSRPLIPESTRELASLMELNEPRTSLTLNIPKPFPVSASMTEMAPITRMQLMEATHTESEKGATLDWKFLGLTKRQQAVFETERGLLFMHCRSAHERIVYENMLKLFADKMDKATQALLIPITFEMDPIGTALLSENEFLLKQGGIDVENFGKNSFRLTGLPLWVNPEEGEFLVRDIVAKLKEGGGKQDAYSMHELVAKQASAKAIRKDNMLTREGIQQLAEDLMACDQPLVSPKGKPTFFEMEYGELDKRLGR